MWDGACRSVQEDEGGAGARERVGAERLESRCLERVNLKLGGMGPQRGKEGVGAAQVGLGARERVHTGEGSREIPLGMEPGGDVKRQGRKRRNSGSCGVRSENVLRRGD